jgi:antitoxin ParD1/3/4
MTSLNIALPEALKEYVEGQVASGDWGTPSESVRELIRQGKETPARRSRAEPARGCTGNQD